MLKVCHIISGDLWAGAEAMSYLLLKGLKTYSNIDLQVILLNNGRLADKIRECGIKVNVVDEQKKSFCRILFEIRNLLKEQPPEIIHSHRYKENIIAYSISKFFPGIRLIATQHGMPENYSNKINFIKHLKIKLNSWMVNNKFNRIVVVSNDLKNNMVNQYGFKENNIDVIHNGIELPKEPITGHKSKKFIIGSAGRLCAVKDYPLMIKIAKSVCERTDKIFFRLAGDGPEREKLQKLVCHYNIEEFFEFCGQVDDISKFYRGLDIFINTSFHEGIPMSILEALAHGLPVIVPMVGGLCEIVENGKNGFIIENRMPDAFAEKCVLLHNNSSMYANMKQAAITIVNQKFSVNHMVSQYYKLYCQEAPE